MAFAWARRARELHDELAAIADVTSLGPTWWLVAGTAAAAEPLRPRAHYVVSDAEPNGDTFIGHRSPSPLDPIVDAISRAHAARTALRELDGQLPDQPLAITIQRGEIGARVIESSLDIAAFAIGDTVVLARLADRVGDEIALVARLAEIARTSTTTFGDDARIRFDSSLTNTRSNDTRSNDTRSNDTRSNDTRSNDTRSNDTRSNDTRSNDTRSNDTTSNAARSDGAASNDIPAPFVCVSIGEDRITVARHGHRRAWRDGAGPWLGLGRVGELATTSTCHMVVDGYGHALLAARIAEHHARLLATSSSPTSSNPTSSNPTSSNPTSSNPTSSNPTSSNPTLSSGLSGADLPHLALVPDAIPLGVAWRELPSPAPRALELAYALGRVLHRVTGKLDAKFSPTFQIPIAPGAPDDPERTKRRVVPTAVSVRFDQGEPEPFEVFADRTRAILAREAQGRGLCSRLLTAARAVPVPLAFKRRSFTAGRAGVFDKIAEVVGGRACLSKIRLSTPVPLSCAVSSPARLATRTDPVGGCVLTIVDDGTRAAITACGSGLAGSGYDAADLIDAVLELLET